MARPGPFYTGTSVKLVQCALSVTLLPFFVISPHPDRPTASPGSCEQASREALGRPSAPREACSQLRSWLSVGLLSAFGQLTTVAPDLLMKIFVVAGSMSKCMFVTLIRELGNFHKDLRVVKGLFSFLVVSLLMYFVSTQLPTLIQTF